MRTPKQRPEYDALVERIKSGELTRLQAAELSTTTGLSAQTFLSWLRSSGKLSLLKETRGNAGVNSPFAHTDPNKVKAYEEAVRASLSGKISVRQAAANHGVCYLYLLRKVKKARHKEADAATVGRLEEALQ